jgi:hypothetical protein
MRLEREDQPKPIGLLHDFANEYECRKTVCYQTLSAEGIASSSKGKSSKIHWFLRHMVRMQRGNRMLLIVRDHPQPV